MTAPYSRYFGLRVAIPLFLLFFFVLASLASSWYRHLQAAIAIEAEAQREAAFILERLHEGLTVALLADDLVLANRTMAGFALHDDLRTVMVVDDAGRIVLSASSSLRGELATSVPNYDPVQAHAVRGIQRLTLIKAADGQRAFVGYSAIHLGRDRGELVPTRNGTLFLIFDYRKHYDRNLAEVQVEVLHVWAAFLAMALVLYLVLYGYITVPVARLVAAARRFAAGDLTPVAAGHGAGELGYLGRVLDEMALALASDRRQLLHAQCSLKAQNNQLVAAAHRHHLLITALEASPSAVAILEPLHHRIIHANRAFGALAGLPTDAVLGRGLDVLSEDLPGNEQIRLIRGRLSTPAGFATEVTLCGQGPTMTYAVSLGPVLGEDGALLAFVACFTDVTAQRRQEERLRHLQKMEALGHLAGGLAHEINNLLQPILTFNKLARKALPSGAATDIYHQHIQESCRKARDIIRNVLTFAQGGTPRLVPLELGETTAAAVALASNSVPPTVQIVMTASSEPLTAAADATEFTQVMLNLISNARDAVGDRGEIRVDLGVHCLDAALAEALKLEPGRFAVLRVEDDGTGMDEEVRRRCLEPFFSTKSVDKGTGLGLSVAVGIVRNWRGAIAVNSTPGKGTTISVYIPLLTAQSRIAA